MSETLKKIVFFGLFGQHNIGNDCTLQAAIHHTTIRVPGAQMSCVCTGPAEVTDRFGIPAFEMYESKARNDQQGQSKIRRVVRKTASRLSREVGHAVDAFRILRGADMLIIPGTGLLVDHTTGFRGYPYYLFKWTLIARMRRCKVMILSMGAGPIYHPVSRFLIRRALSMADFRSYRDTFSKDYIDGIGFETDSDHVYPDLAFGLPKSVFPAESKYGSDGRTVGVGLIDYFGQGANKTVDDGDSYHDYLDKMAEFVGWLVNSGYRVRLLIGDVKYDSNVQRDIIELLERNRETSGEELPTSNAIHSLKDLLAEISHTDIVISPRFHNIILALMMRKRVIALSYNEKFEALMSQMGYECFSQGLDGLDIEALKEQFTVLIRNGDLAASHVGAKMEEYRRDVAGQFDALLGKPKTHIEDSVHEANYATKIEP